MIQKVSVGSLKYTDTAPDRRDERRQIPQPPKRGVADGARHRRRFPTSQAGSSVLAGWGRAPGRAAIGASGSRPRRL